MKNPPKRPGLPMSAAVTALALVAIACSSGPPPKCQGRARGCEDVPAGSSCGSQRGCTWVAAHCEGVRQYNCEILAGRQKECLEAGCRWQDLPANYKPDAGYYLTCYGGYNSFECKPYTLNLTNQSTCETFGCRWESAVCDGFPDSCDELTTKLECEEQAGCTWQ